MTKMALYFNFSPYLMLHLRLLQLAFEEHFECYNMIAPLLSRQVDMTKLASSKWLSNIKVIEGPPFLLCCRDLVLCLILRSNHHGRKRSKATDSEREDEDEDEDVERWRERKERRGLQ
uniref:Uncharacterized protein n=1 Tax=Opuntia streptacantha TaxID=393608 RepID=A0A7C8ZRM6_OPUST